MKYILLAAIIFLFASCSDAPFINHTLKAEKIGPCTSGDETIRMEGNINGERYIFNDCLDDNFDGKNYTIVRTGDTLIVKFEKMSKKTALYKITLDVDAKPAYHHITLGGQTIAIAPTNKF